MKESTKQRIEAIINMVEGPVTDPDSTDPEQLLSDLNQVWTMCKNALLEDPVQSDLVIEHRDITDMEAVKRFIKLMESKQAFSLVMVRVGFQGVTSRWNMEERE